MNTKFLCLLAAMAIPCYGTAAQAANPQHLDQLQTSKRCNEPCDLSQADLSGWDLTGAQLVGANLNGANLVGTNLTGANLTRASIVAANLAGANLRQAKLSETTFVYSNLVRAQLQGALVFKADFQSANLAEMDLSSAQVSKSSFTHANTYGLRLPETVNANARGEDANGNTFTKDTLGVLAGEGGPSVSRQVTSDGGVDTFESGGDRGPRRFRRYSIPAWIGMVQRSTAGASRLHQQDLHLDLW
jgi:uncharacterized protein YjbI with pentapeptide repeats